MTTGTFAAVQAEPQTESDRQRTSELEVSQSLALRYSELAHTFEARPVDSVLRGFDIVISGLLLVLFSPVIILMSLAILVTSGRPILYIGPKSSDVHLLCTASESASRYSQVDVGDAEAVFRTLEQM